MDGGWREEQKKWLLFDPSCELWLLLCDTITAALAISGQFCGIKLGESAEKDEERCLGNVVIMMMMGHME